jgi:hypothetical protein
MNTSPQSVPSVPDAGSITAFKMAINMTKTKVLPLTAMPAIRPSSEAHPILSTSQLTQIAIACDSVLSLNSQIDAIPHVMPAIRPSSEAHPILSTSQLTQTAISCDSALPLHKSLIQIDTIPPVPLHVLDAPFTVYFESNDLATPMATANPPPSQTPTSKPKRFRIFKIFEKTMNAIKRGYCKMCQFCNKAKSHCTTATSPSLKPTAYTYYADDTPLTPAQIECEMNLASKYILSITEEKGIF